MTGVDIALEAFADGHGDPERAITLARSWVIIGRNSISEAEFKQTIIDRIWDLCAQLDEPVPENEFVRPHRPDAR
jgi:hypothetical protein